MVIIKGKLKNLLKNYYAYTVQDDKELVYVGFGKLSDVFTLREICTVEGFDMDKEYTTMVIGEYETRYMALNAATDYITSKCGGRTPRFNLLQNRNRGRRVKCNETNIIYDNASVACEALNLDPPRMSNHLAKKPGHRHIYGLTFSYVD